MLPIIWWMKQYQETAVQGNFSKSWGATEKKSVCSKNIRILCLIAQHENSEAPAEFTAKHRSPINRFWNSPCLKAGDSYHFSQQAALLPACSMVHLTSTTAMSQPDLPSLRKPKYVSRKDYTWLYALYPCSKGQSFTAQINQLRRLYSSTTGFEQHDFREMKLLRQTVLSLIARPA